MCMPLCSISIYNLFGIYRCLVIEVCIFISSVHIICWVCTNIFSWVCKICSTKIFNLVKNANKKVYRSIVKWDLLLKILLLVIRWCNRNLIIILSLWSIVFFLSFNASCIWVPSTILYFIAMLAPVKWERNKTQPITWRTNKVARWFVFRRHIITPMEYKVDNKDFSRIIFSKTDIL
jgi:hypothetical protein